MSGGQVIGTAPCPDCGGTIRYTEAKGSGGISGSCDGCKSQFFHRSPRAVEGLKKRIAGGGSKPAAEKQTAEQGAAAGFDLGKL
jgi:hypothetical protein